IGLAALTETAREGLMALSAGLGLAVLGEIFEEELTQLVGPRGKHSPQRQAYRHRQERGQMTLGGRRGEVQKPRARAQAGGGVEVESYRFFASRDLLTRAALDRMLAGLSTRHYRAGLGAGREAGAEGDLALVDLAPLRGWHHSDVARADGLR